ncbi:PepSY domain-containing protein [Sinorhizobium sojae]|nr:PepSY domain-containing protein [Sinorhizobium sojae]
MKSMFICALAVAALPCLASAGDDTSCTNEPRSAWMTPDEAVFELRQDGYSDVQGIKVVGNCYEIYAFTTKHERADVYMNPVNAEIVRAEIED